MTPAQPTQTLSNVTARRDFFASACEEMYQLDAEIKALIDKHIRPLREQKGDIMRVLREDYHMPAPIFRARYYGYRIERQASDGQDDVTLDIIRELFEALPIGEIVDVMDAAGIAEGTAGSAVAEGAAGDGAAGQAEPAAATEQDAEAHDRDDAQELGRRAGLGGESLTTCPYRGAIQKNLRAAWETGWEQGQHELAAGKQHEGASASQH